MTTKRTLLTGGTALQRLHWTAGAGSLSHPPRSHCQHCERELKPCPRGTACPGTH